jgi:hypothetical protein
MRAKTGHLRTGRGVTQVLCFISVSPRAGVVLLAESSLFGVLSWWVVPFAELASESTEAPMVGVPGGTAGGAGFAIGFIPASHTPRRMTSALQAM